MQHNHPDTTLYTPASCPLCALAGFRALTDAEVQLALGRLIGVILADIITHPEGWAGLAAEVKAELEAAAAQRRGPDGRG